MASQGSPDDSLFEKSRVSLKVTKEGAEQFFQQHGVFYESNTEIGKLAATIAPSVALNNSRGLDRFKEIYMREPRLRFLQQYREDFAFVIGADDYYYCSTTKDAAAKDRISVYMLRPGTLLRFGKGGHALSFEPLDETVYKLCAIPYIQIESRCEEVRVIFESGGIC
ncbi:hypothetical protein BKA67DRAFT_537116 [Truncatella angustata]|uniref:Uncharacterized protein n=1 Tax=Truncatella angustata TaxID=152316 RepID=A0A9P8UJV2_9PEZI|nr:uncharacterized protein BKA67DRAFT_537116 [Truncatella angustata]KAH6653436.1 hypothetical protein BKA67DRAFT_537116 [Truncatella angustata]